MEMCSAQLGGLNASTSALGSNPWPITLRCRLSCIGRLRSSFALALPAPLIKVLAPPPKHDPGATGKPDAIYTSQQVDGELPCPCWHWRVYCCVEGACGEVGMWSWLARSRRYRCP